MKTVTKVLLLLLTVLSFSSCTKEGNTVYVDDDAVNDTIPVVYFISQQGSLGDLGYIDALYTGTVRATVKGNMKIALAELPTDSTQAESQFRSLLQQLTKESQRRKTLMVIANNDMEPMLHRCEDNMREASSVDILLAETDDTTLPLHSLRIQQYGAYYQAGKLVIEGLGSVDSILVVSANPHNTSIQEMREGFAQAIADAGKEDAGKHIGVDNIYLSQTNEGYNMQDYAYKLSFTIASKYDLVLPLCGGTAQGFLRYAREYVGSYYFNVIGVDNDMQSYSNLVPFSVVKHIDNAVADWIQQWREGVEMPQHRLFGLSSGYTEIVCSDGAPQLAEVAKKFYQQSIEKEKAYENK